MPRFVYGLGADQVHVEEFTRRSVTTTVRRESPAVVASLTAVSGASAPLGRRGGCRECVA